MYVIGRAGRLQEFEKVLIGSFCFLLGMHHNLYRVNKLQVVIYSLTFLKKPIKECKKRDSVTSCSPQTQYIKHILGAVLINNRWHLLPQKQVYLLVKFRLSTKCGIFSLKMLMSFNHWKLFYKTNILRELLLEYVIILA